MNFSSEKAPYSDAENNSLDFDKKRFQFWLETVPSDVRRLEYEIYKKNRERINAEIYRSKNTKRYGPFMLLPAFTKELSYEAWENFQKSFLKGEERKRRFSEILESAKIDLPALLEKYADVIPADKIKLIALSGSSIIGPRKEKEFLSDIDLDFLLDQEDGELNFDILPDEKKKEEIPYHLFGTGYGDAARGKGRDVHWLLYPHFPIQNSLSDQELKSIIERLVITTKQRKDEILETIENMKRILGKKSNEEIIEL